MIKQTSLYQAGYSVQRTDTKRDVFTGQTAEAKYNSKIASLDLKLMRCKCLIIFYFNL
ncbi:hypothetical protein MASR2M54_20790 [Aliarcobacter cryaerophilus]